MCNRCLLRILERPVAAAPRPTASCPSEVPLAVLRVQHLEILSLRLSSITRPRSQRIVLQAIPSVLTCSARPTHFFDSGFIDGVVDLLPPRNAASTARRSPNM